MWNDVRSAVSGDTAPRRARHVPLLAALALTAAALLAACSESSATGLSEPAMAGDEISATTAPDGEPSVDDEPVEKITVAGDSISVGLGSSLREVVDEDVTVKVIGEVGTGLARPDDFDWPERLRELARDFPPDVLVFSLSSNDAQDLVDGDGDLVAARSDTAKWDLEYASRLAESFDAFEHTGTTVLWVGHVRTEKDRVGLANRHIHQLAVQIAASRPWVVVADLATILGTGADVAEDCLVADGLHLDTDCLDLAAQELATTEPIA